MASVFILNGLSITQLAVDDASHYNSNGDILAKCTEDSQAKICGNSKTELNDFVCKHFLVTKLGKHSSSANGHVSRSLANVKFFGRGTY